jgi:uncharacterized membrane protein YqgA involved in biofilm formation
MEIDFIGLGTIVNTFMIFAGGLSGLLLKRWLSSRLSGAITQALGLAVILVGLGGALSAAFTVADGLISVNYTMSMIISLVAGGLIGELLNIEARLQVFGNWCEKKIVKNSDGPSFSKAFTSASLLFCVGAMSIVGSIEDGISHSHGTLFAKSVIDAVSSMIFSSTMGVGVLFSGVSVFIYQGLITVAAVFVAPYLTATVIAQMSLIGSILIMSIGLNMLKITEIRVGNLLPSIFAPILINFILGLFK